MTWVRRTLRDTTKVTYPARSLMLFQERLSARVLPRPVKFQQLVFVFHGHLQARFKPRFLARQQVFAYSVQIPGTLSA